MATNDETNDRDRLQFATDAEVVEAGADVALQLRDPRQAGALDQLSAYGPEQAAEIFDARMVLLETARKRAMRLTFPSDWNFYQDPAAEVTCFLSDAGCQRVRDITGVEILKVSEAKRHDDPDGSFIYVQTGSGRSRFTGQTVEDVIGWRSSTDEVNKGLKGKVLDISVQVACRANLNGSIARELMGLKNVPLDELKANWEGTGKDWTKGHKARGFGSAGERLGAAKAGTPDVPPPTCKVCKGPDGKPLPLLYRAATNTYKAFYGCRNWADHKNVDVKEDAAKWVAQHQAKPAAPAGDSIDEENKRIDAEIAAREGQK